MQKVDEPKNEAGDKKFSLQEIIGLVGFLAGLSIVMVIYFISKADSMFLIGFVAGLFMIALGGGIVVYYEGKGRTETK